MIFGMSIRQFLQIRDLGDNWELQSSSSSLVDVNSLFPPAVCFTPSLKIIACSVLCIHLFLCQRLPALYLSAKREHVPLLPLQVSALGWAAEESKCTEDSVWRWLRGCSVMEGQAGSWYSAVPAWFARDMYQCPQSFVIKVVIFCLPAVVNYSAQPLSVFVWIYFRGFSFMLFDNGQGALEQSGLNAC